ncbi:hypothetical protein P7K49_008036, partial [Saguinus oedipus]
PHKSIQDMVQFTPVFGDWTVKLMVILATAQSGQAGRLALTKAMFSLHQAMPEKHWDFLQLGMVPALSSLPEGGAEGMETASSGERK